MPAIALSQAVDANGATDWAVAEARGVELIRRLVGCSWPDDVLINVNFPACAPEAVTGVQVVPHGKRKIADDVCERVDPRGRTYYWIGPLHESDQITPGCDLAVLLGNGIAVTPLHLDLTHQPTVEALAASLG